MIRAFAREPGGDAAGSPASGAAGWLALAATPTFALMALIGANDAPGHALHASTSGALWVDGMTAMYLLMSLFHAPPWLKRAGRGLRARG